ncbi:heat shock factor protein 1 isoform X2 [Lates japonicus]|uniref:Heat shock factor protein 1 isoform X2 n=1 Tax=Lates japonicus TaxID=270547 RepID=A0AAD3NEU1_LATJO|nr:heat shock factor protein 1 isoform X2 [Lates japonicus]
MVIVSPALLNWFRVSSSASGGVEISAVSEQNLERCPADEGKLETYDSRIIRHETDIETQPTPNTSTANPPPAIVVRNPASTGPLPPVPISQSPASVPTPNSSTTTAQQRCQTVACIDRSELSDHVDSMDDRLENQQNIPNTQTFAFDTSPLFEFFSSSSTSGDFDLDSLDTLLSDEAPKGSDESCNTNNTGKQLVQYTPVLVSEPASPGEGGAEPAVPAGAGGGAFLCPGPAIR